MKYNPVATWEQYETAEKNGIPKKNVDQRINVLGWTIDEAITKPIRVTFRQKYAKYVKLAEQNTIPFNTFRARVEIHKWDPQKAATTPIMTYREAVKKTNDKRRIIPEAIYEKARNNGIHPSTLKTRILMLKWDMDLAATKQPGKNGKKQIS